MPIWAPAVREGAVVLDGEDTVLAVGPRADLVPAFSALPEERAPGALMPALVNAHTHLELSALHRAVPGGEGFVSWASQLVALARPDAAAAQAAARSAADSMRAAGTAAVADVGNTVAAVAAIGAAGLQGLFLHELVGSREDRTGDALDDAEQERAAHTREAGWPARLAYVPAPHAPYSVGPELFRRIFVAAARTGHPTSVHVAEGEDELALLLDGTGPWAKILEARGVPRGSRTPGMRPVPYLASLGAFEGPRPPLLVHMVHAHADDRALARRHGAPVVLCPRSNLHVSGRLPDVRALVADDLLLALGTDSLASNDDLSLWGEMRALCAAFPDLPAATWLAAATAGGAAALAAPALGALAPGKRPGIIAVSLDDDGAADPLPALVRNPSPRIRWMAQA